MTKAWAEKVWAWGTQPPNFLDQVNFHFSDFIKPKWFVIHCQATGVLN